MKARWIILSVVSASLMLAAAWFTDSFSNSPPAAPRDPGFQSPCACMDWPRYPESLCRQDAFGFTDTFAVMHPRWNWMETAGSGYHRLLAKGTAPAVEIGIGPGGGPDESDCSLEELAPLRRWGSCFFKLRCSDANTDPGAGTMGWGVWKPGGPSDLHALWFLSCSGKSDSRFRGFFAMYVRKGEVVFMKRLSTDITALHDYRIEIRKTGAAFIIDGQKRAASGPLPDDLPCMKTVCWIDNKVLGLDKGCTVISHERTLVPKSLTLFSAGFHPLKN